MGYGEVAFVFYAEPLAKAAFLDNTLSKVGCDSLYVDFDLMYSGHVASGILPRRKGVDIISPVKGGIKEAFASVIDRASQARHLVIIDSLNGLRRACTDSDLYAANSALMVLASLARQSGSSVLIPCAARQDAESEWWLSPVGGKITNLGPKTGQLYVKPSKEGFEIESLGTKPTLESRSAPNQKRRYETD